VAVASLLEVVCARDQRPGQILGRYEDACDGYHGILYQKGCFRTIDVPSKPIQALGLTIAARSLTERRPRFRQDQRISAGRRRSHHDRRPREPSTNALDIHNRGDITGLFAGAGRTGHGYLRDRNGVFT
jgi:hypothetical protein